MCVRACVCACVHVCVHKAIITYRQEILHQAVGNCKTPTRLVQY